MDPAESETDSTRETETPNKPRRQPSPAQIAANRANSRLSTGPRSDQGKSVSRLNGVTHGMTCHLPVVLPGEDPEQFQGEVARWEQQLGAATEAERAQVEAAVSTRWRMRRAREAEATAVAEAIAGLEEGYDDRRAAEVRATIALLPQDPDGAVRRLRSSTAGCDWLLMQWGLMDARLKTHRSFEPSQRGLALQLTGRLPGDLFRDPVVLAWNRAYLGGIRGTDGYTAAQAAMVLRFDRPPEMNEPEFERRLKLVVSDLPTVLEGHALLMQYVREVVDELTERRELIELREERDRARAVIKARVDVSAEGVKRSRYEAMSDRAHHAALRELRGLQEMRRKSGEVGSEGSD